MNYINFILICFQIWCIFKYISKLKDNENMLKDNIQDYFELKAQNAKLECYIKELDDKIENLKKCNCLHNEK